jgi:hypothetical protein
MVDFSLLCEPWYNYEQQEQIDLRCIKMASAAMVHFGLNPGKFVQWMGGQYTGYHRDVQRTLVAVARIPWLRITIILSEFCLTDVLQN